MNVVEFLRSAESDTKSCHHFIENQHSFFAFRDQTQSYQVVIRGGNAAHVSHHRLHDHARDLMLELLEGVLDRLDVIEGQGQSKLNELLGNTCGAWNAQRRYARTCLH